MHHENPGEYLYQFHKNHTGSITMTYSGGGDSGGPEDVAFDNGTYIDDQIIQDYLWDLLCEDEDGFWNNEGGEGVITSTYDEEQDVVIIFIKHTNVGESEPIYGTTTVKIRSTTQAKLALVNNAHEKLAKITITSLDPDSFDGMLTFTSGKTIHSISPTEYLTLRSGLKHIGRK